MASRTGRRTDLVTVPQGLYHLDWKAADAQNGFFYRPEHLLAQSIIVQAVGRNLETVRLHLDYTALGQRISALTPYIGSGGWLAFS